MKRRLDKGGCEVASERSPYRARLERLPVSTPSPEMHPIKRLFRGGQGRLALQSECEAEDATVRAQQACEIVYEVASERSKYQARLGRLPVPTLSPEMRPIKRTFRGDQGEPLHKRNGVWCEEDARVEAKGPCGKGYEPPRNGPSIERALGRLPVPTPSPDMHPTQRTFRSGRGKPIFA